MNDSPRIAKVLVTGPDLGDGSVGGIQRHVQQLAEWFADGSRGFEVSPFGSTTAVQAESMPVKIVRSVRRTWAFGKIAGDFDLVHINSTLDARSVLRDSALILAATIRGVPTVVQFHGGAVAGLGVLSRGIPSRGLSWLFRYPRKILFLSTEQADAFKRVFGTASVSVTRNHIDADDPGPSALRPVVRVLMLGRLTAEKGAGEFEELTRRVDREHVRFDAAGEGPLAEQIQCLAETDSRVTYHGHVSGPIKQHLLDRADILVLPTCRDALPFALIEAAAARTALVAYDVGEVSAVVRSGINGWLVAPADIDALAARVQALADDPDSLRAMRDASRALFEECFDGTRGRDFFARAVYGEVVVG